MRNTVLEVSRDAFLKNYESIKKYKHTPKNTWFNIAKSK